MSEFISFVLFIKLEERKNGEIIKIVLYGSKDRHVYLQWVENGWKKAEKPNRNKRIKKFAFHYSYAFLLQEFSL